MVDGRFVELRGTERRQDERWIEIHLTTLSQSTYVLLDINYDWLEFNKVKLNIIMALWPPLVVLTRFFITKYSVYYK